MSRARDDAVDSPPSTADGPALLSLVYAELRALADAYLARERPGHTLQATALVHEAWLRLGGGGRPTPETRARFLGVAARAMRQVLVDHARRRNRAKRVGGRHRVPLGDLARATSADRLDVLAVDEALQALAAVAPRAARVVELRFFGGLGVAEAARALDVTPRTCERDWRYAQAWLRRELAPPAPGAGPEA